MSEIDVNRKIMAVELLRPDPNYLLHFALTILTGFWGFVWLTVALRSREINKDLDRQIKEIRAADAAQLRASMGLGPTPAGKDKPQQ